MSFCGFLLLMADRYFFIGAFLHLAAILFGASRYWRIAGSWQ